MVSSFPTKLLIEIVLFLKVGLVPLLVAAAEVVVEAVVDAVLLAEAVVVHRRRVASRAVPRLSLYVFFYTLQVCVRLGSCY